MDTITVNGVEFKVDNDRTNIAICENEAGGVLIEANIDHDAEQIIINVYVEDIARRSTTSSSFTTPTPSSSGWLIDCSPNC